ncbi:unnamed protein product [Cercospora beticola]|nr:unnamed protein product [Cercospora beticola]
MAYDQHSTYEPPRRAYQTRAPAPATGQQSYNDYADFASTPFDHYEQYDQPAHAQARHQQYGGHEANYAPSVKQGYDNRYEQAQSASQYHEPRFDQQYAPPEEYGQDRHYDARYQPRAPQQRSPPHVHQGLPPNAGSMRSDTSGQPALEQYDHRDNGYAPPVNGYGYAQPQEANHGHVHASSKSSMDEWKAKERSRLQAETRSPQTLPFDNAFPDFGNQKQARPGSKGSEGKHAGSRSQHEQRPKTAGQQQPQGSWENSYDTAAHGPTRDQGAGHSNVRDYNHTHQGRPAQGQAPPHPSGHQLGSPIDQHFDFGLGQDPSPPTNGYHPDSYAHSASQQQDYASSRQAERAAPQHRGPTAVPPLDTSRTQYQQTPVYNTSQPLSPTHVPPRPSTAQAARAQAVHQPAVPLSEPQSATFHDDYASVPQKPFAREDYGRPASLGDIIDDYGADPAPKPLQRKPTTREEEIEADMPDFDSAAPAQRLQANNASRGPAPTTIHPPAHPGLPHSSSAPDVRYDQPPIQHDPNTQAGYRPPPRHDGYHPGASSVPPQLPHTGAQDSRMRAGPPPDMQPPQAPFAHDPPVRRSLDDGRPMPYRNGPPPPQRFDAQGRPLPRGPPNGMRGGPMAMRGGPNGMRGGPNGMRGGPNGMRGNPNGMRGRGGPNGMPMGRGHPPRPDLDRQGTAWSDPGMNRAGSAPPTRGPLHGAHGMAAPPLTQQRSAPDQNPSSNNPDALPHHPVPVRPGLMENGGPGQAAKPPPVRNYGGTQSAPPIKGAPPHERQASKDHFAQPVTIGELEHLRSSVDASPDNAKKALILVKKLVEASTVLAAEGGRADPRTTVKNRERYVLEADKRLKKLVQGGYADAQFYLADCYGSGALGLEFDAKEAFKLYQAAAKGNHPEAAYRTAVCCEIGPEEGGGTSRDYAKAVQWYRRAATLGDGPGMYKLGAVLLKGLLGQQRNIVEAVIWLKRAAEKADADNPHALHELAQLYESDNTNPEIRNKLVADDSYARELFQKAATLGYKNSQFRLGQAYEYGHLGCTIDNRMSIAYYTKAAAQGEHQAELALSGWYLTGAPGILENSDTEAYLWARKAASSEPPLAKAMFAMGYFTENGIGCPQSMEEAKKWYSRAASYKFPKAIERLEELKRGGGKKDKSFPPPSNGKLTRKDQKRDEENCVVM